jgi:hypothetical protein
MATNAILMNHISSGFMNKNNLRFQTKGKHRSMTHSIFRLEKILVEHVVVWHVALVTIGVLPVRTVVPGGILRRHNVAVDTGFRIIRQIRIGFAHVKKEEKKPDKDSHDEHYWESPLFRRKKM